MLAPIVNVDGEQIGVHLTYLRHDGGGKAQSLDSSDLAGPAV
jgi:hypothetical protein